MTRENRAARRRRNRAAAGASKPDRSERRNQESGSSWGEPLPWWRVLSVAAAFALLVGFLEAALVRHVVSSGIPLRVSEDYLWMAPTAYLLGLGLLGTLLVGVGQLWRRAATLPVVVALSAGLATYSFLLTIEWLHPLATFVLMAGIGWQLGRLARGRFGTFLNRFAPPAALVLVVLLAGVTARSLGAEDRAEARAHALLPAAPSAPNVLLIILDTVRATSLGLYEAATRNSPNLEQFSREAAVFDHAYAPSPWTLPAHATMFTGVWPFQHGADWRRPLGDRYTTLAEVLAAHGYATAGFVGNLTWASYNYGLDRGFDRYEDYPVNLGQIILSSGLGRQVASLDGLRAALGLHHVLNRVPAADVTDRFLRWHEAREGDRPFFAFLNYFDAHEPVAPLLEPEPLAPLEHRAGLVTGAVAHFVNRPGLSQGRFLREYRRGYEATIAELDRELGRLFRELDQRGVLDSTVVVVTSDHGEMIGEHGLFGHNSSLYLPTLHVPLLIRYPGSVPAGVRIQQRVSLRNLAATVLDLTGLDDASLPGRSMLEPEGANQSSITGDTVYAHLSRGPDLRIPPWAPVTRGPFMESVIDSSFQYILNGDGSEELYDIRANPVETRNLAPSRSTDLLLDRMRALLRQLHPGGNASD